MGDSTWEIPRHKDSNPWLAHEKVGIRIDDPRHALTRSFTGQSFDIVDEIYQLTDNPHTHFRKNIRVLLTLDMARECVCSRTMKRRELLIGNQFSPRFDNPGERKRYIRDPLTVSFSPDGYVFTRVYAWPIIRNHS